MKYILHKKWNRKIIVQASVVVHACVIPAAWEAEAGGFQVWGQPKQLNKTPSQKKERKKKKNYSSLIDFKSYFQESSMLL
jgi:hypothetical protein